MISLASCRPVNVVDNLSHYLNLIFAGFKLEVFLFVGASVKTRDGVRTFSCA